MSERGRVKFYNSGRADGLIKRKGKPDVHFGRDSFKGTPPAKGDEVVFDVTKSGEYAKNLKIIQKAFNKSEEILIITDSFDISKTKLPEDTKKILDDFKNVDNFNLKINKLARFENDKFKFFETDRRGVLYPIRTNFSDSFIMNTAKRYYGSIKRFNLKFSEDLVLKTEWRMVIGMGNESVYETSMTLHHIYGIPYIPGSAIKGVVRSHIITEAFAEAEKDQGDSKKIEERSLSDPGFCDIFGCPQKSFYKESRQGKIIFFDAFPLSKPQIKPDVMNPHYGPYYSDSSGTVPPADYHNPKPIFFLTVVDTEFRFIIGIKEKDNNTIQQGEFKDKYPLETAYECMKKALCEHGIGAKTAVGYGYMNSARHGN